MSNCVSLKVRGLCDSTIVVIVMVFRIFLDRKLAMKLLNLILIPNTGMTILVLSFDPFLGILISSVTHL